MSGYGRFRKRTKEESEAEYRRGLVDADIGTINFTNNRMGGEMSINARERGLIPRNAVRRKLGLSPEKLERVVRNRKR